MELLITLSERQNCFKKLSINLDILSGFAIANLPIQIETF